MRRLVSSFLATSARASAVSGCSDSLVFCVRGYESDVLGTRDKKLEGRRGRKVPAIVDMMVWWWGSGLKEGGCWTLLGERRRVLVWGSWACRNRRARLGDGKRQEGSRTAGGWKGKRRVWTRESGYASYMHFPKRWQSSSAVASMSLSARCSAGVAHMTSVVIPHRSARPTAAYGCNAGGERGSLIGARPGPGPWPV